MLRPHPLPKDSAQFMESLTPTERRLQELARVQLASSYFMEKTHAYKKWSASQNKDSKKSSK
jgi:hypothetical protein